MVSFAVFAYNEEANIADTVETVVGAAALSQVDEFEVIVVDDGSTDRTSEIVAKLAASDPRIRLIRQDRNRGVGAAVRRGLELARFDSFVTVPGDNDMSRDVLRLLLQYRNRADMVMAFPINTEARSLRRNILSALYRLFYVSAFRVFVNYLHAPCVYPTAKLRTLNLRSERFSIITEINVKLLCSGCSYAEVPGFFHNPKKDRSTVTLRNLVEVTRGFLTLLYEVYVKRRHVYNEKPRRVVIDFLAHGPDIPVVYQPRPDSAVTPKPGSGHVTGSGTRARNAGI